MAIDLDGKRPPHQFNSEANRHFFSHGVYSSDGKLLLSTENDMAGQRGILGVRDATDGYKPVGVFATGGTGPHDVVMLSDNRTLVVANGGIDTDPGGREPIYLSTMKPALTYIDSRTGDIIEQVEFGPDLKPLSIRHLAVVANDTVVIGCQWAGDKLEHPQLVAVHRRGEKLKLMEIPRKILRRMRNYVGSVSVDNAGEIAAVSAPKGGLAVYFDVVAQRFIGAEWLHDVCGVAPTNAPGEFSLTSGDGIIRKQHVDADGRIVREGDVSAELHWDNHLVFIA